MICEKCGKEISTGASFCEYCGHAVNHSQQPAQAFAAAVPQKKENMVAGIVGALIGAVLGGASIVLLSQLGIVASVSGLILAICTLKGYELLGGKLSGKGIAVCIILVLVTPYIADRLDWAILVAREFGVSLGEAFAAVPDLIANDMIEIGVYMKNLLMIYGFALLGAFSTIRGAFKK